MPATAHWRTQQSPFSHERRAQEEEEKAKEEEEDDDDDEEVQRPKTSMTILAVAYNF